MIIQGSSAVVTGGAAGIGLEISRCLLDRGCGNVAICDISEERLCKAGAELGEYADKVSLHKMDVRNRDEIQRVAEDIVSKWGRVSILFNNAGVVAANSIEASEWEDLEFVIDVNLWGVINCTKIFLPVLKAEKAACIVNVSSVEGIVALPGNLSYCTSKYAVRGFTEALMMDHKLTRPNVKVCCVHPGFVRTQIMHHNCSTLNTTHLTPSFLKDAKWINFDLLQKGFSCLGSTTPESAGLQIVNGVARGDARIMVGTDAYLLDFVARLLPRVLYRRPVYFTLIPLIMFLVRMVGKKTIAAAVLLYLAKSRWAIRKSP
mmetsp:Transcript_34171/g.54731  ORF Transcript_34171/g.54731 Transcript_34171/m.54731 type:complete len:318 (-) Transcript_34171:86-1039(-)